MIVGVQVSTAGHIYEACDRAHKLGCVTMQIFSRNSRRWYAKPFLQEEVNEFVKRRRLSRINPLFVHIPYLINLASPDLRLYQHSIEVYIEDVWRAKALQADYLITHMGSHKDTSAGEGLERFIQGLKKIIDATQSTAGILLENTAGGGSALGYDFRHQEEIIKRLNNPKIGICLDTAHVYAAGYDVSSEAGINNLLEDIDRRIGLEKLKVVHLNDCRSKLGSKHDVHEHIGKGYIGLTGMRMLINHPQLRNLPFILETPKDSEEADRINLDMVHRLRDEYGTDEGEKNCRGGRFS